MVSLPIDNNPDIEMEEEESDEPEGNPFALNLKEEDFWPDIVLPPEY